MLDPTYPTAPSTPLTTTAGIKLCSFLMPSPGTSHLTTSISFTHRSRWTRISIPLPNSALTDATRFRWKQSGSVAGSMWAIDNGWYYNMGANSLKLRHNQTSSIIQGYNEILIFTVYFSVHWSRLPSFLLWKGTLFPDRLQVRLGVLFNPNKSNILKNTPLVSIPPAFLPADLLFPLCSIYQM